MSHLAYYLFLEFAALGNMFDEEKFASNKRIFYRA
jgi:hypothetical protein